MSISSIKYSTVNDVLNINLLNDVLNVIKYGITSAQIGNKKRNLYLQEENLLVSGLPTKANLGFEKVSAEANKIALLEIRCCSGKGDRFQVQFRNIPLNK